MKLYLDRACLQESIPKSHLYHYLQGFEAILRQGLPSGRHTEITFLTLFARIRSHIKTGFAFRNAYRNLTFVYAGFDAILRQSWLQESIQKPPLHMPAYRLTSTCLRTCPHHHRHHQHHHHNYRHHLALSGFVRLCLSLSCFVRRSLVDKSPTNNNKFANRRSPN